MLDYLRKIQHSIAAKILGVFILTAVLLIFILWESLDFTFEDKVSETVHPYFSKYLIYLNDELGFPPKADKAKKITNNNSVDIIIDAPDYHWSSNNEALDKAYLKLKDHKTNKAGMIFRVGIYKGNFTLQTVLDDYTTYFIVTDDMSAPQLRETFLITAIVITVIGLLYSVIYYLFYPIKAVERGIKRIGNGDVNYRININSNDEIGELSKSVNKMANSIESMLEAKRQLLLSISHELRTPITRSRIALSLMEDSDIKDSLEEDMQEMENLIQELLESERLRSNHAPLEIVNASINEIIYQVQGRFFVNDNIKLQLANDLPNVNIDANRIGLAVKNLIKNSLVARINDDDEVLVQTAIKGENLIISVIDHGKGVAPEKIPQLTEPFYRTDESRQRKTGGFGIGLYLIKEIVDAHGAELNIESELNVGTTVTISLPIS